MDIWRYSDWWGLGAEVRNSPEAHLALARLDRRVAQRRQGLRPDGPRDARRRRAVSRTTSIGCAPPGSSPGNYFKFNRNTWLDETVEHTAKALLGLTFNCAKCHDHKYDPITPGRLLPLPRVLRAVSGPHRHGPRRDRLREGRHPPRLRLQPRRADLSLHIRGDDRNPRQEPSHSSPGSRRSCRWAIWRSSR